MNRTKLPCVLSIAGTDPSGGAGIQADIKTISATGAYAASIITALVSQNTQGVQAIEPVSSLFIQQQFDSVFDDLNVQAIKIGMLHEERIMQIVFSQLRTLAKEHVVFDPVMTAKCGSNLLDLQAIQSLKELLPGVLSLITPNLFEAKLLLGQPLASLEDMEAAALHLGQELQTNVLIKGGHFEGHLASDVLYLKQEKACHWFHAPKILTKNTHGTGCSLSSAIASYLAQGMGLKESVAKAKSYLSQAIEAGAVLQIGKGNGPVDHFYFLGNEGL